MREITVSGSTYATPLFLPVYKIGNAFISLESLREDFSVDGIITNAFLIYKRREYREILKEQPLKEFLGFDGLIVTDSGAFQAFKRPLYLSNRKIIKFQQDIGVDIISPLDVVTPPGDNRTIATRKLATTLKRIREGLDIIHSSILIGVQQGGRFQDLRVKALEDLADLGVSYVALGSLVPLLNRNHDLEFVGMNIRYARDIFPSEVPVHLYGSGDPLELPFYIALGCDVFDSSSYIHYAVDHWYMTPYGALNTMEEIDRTGYKCECPYCGRSVTRLLQEEVELAKHNLWTILNIVKKVRRMLKDGTLDEYLEHVIDVHQKLFPDSKLEESWVKLH